MTELQETHSVGFSSRGAQKDIGILEGGRDSRVSDLLNWLPGAVFDEHAPSLSSLGYYSKINGGELFENSVALLMLEKIAQADPKSTLEIFLEGSNIDLKTDQLEVILTVWVQKETVDFMRYFDNEFTGKNGEILRSAYLEVLIENRPKMAASVIGGDGRRRGKGGALYRAFANMEPEEVEGSLLNIEKTLSSDLRLSALKGAVSSLSNTDFDGALALIEECEVSEKAGLYRELLDAVPEHKSKFVFDFIAQVEDPSLRKQYFIENVEKLSRSLPSETISLAMSQQSEEVLYFSISHSLDNLDKEELSDVMISVENLSPGERRDSLVRDIFEVRAEDGVLEAISWAENMGVSLSEEDVSKALQEKCLIW